VLDSIKVCQWD